MARYFARKWRTNETSFEADSLDLKGSAEEVEEYLQHTAPEVWNAGLWRVAGDLSAQQRAVLLLRHLDGFSTQEVAVLLGISENSVRTHGEGWSHVSIETGWGTFASWSEGGKTYSSVTGVTGDYIDQHTTDRKH